MSHTIVRLLKEPLIQFLLIGACIYGAYGLFAPPEQPDTDTTVIVDAARIKGFVAQWSARWNRPPTSEELDGLINSYIREEILYRQAVTMGLAEDDPVTRRRMAQRLEFLTSDLVRLAEPEDAVLEEYLLNNTEQFREPDRLSFLQIFFDPDRRDAATLDDANAALSRLRAAGEPVPDEVEEGDQVMLPAHFESVAELEIRKRLGGGFTDSLLALEPGTWHGPVLSGFGVHLVYIYKKEESPTPLLADVRPQVLEAWQSERMLDFNKNFYETLKARYDIVIEDAALPPGSILQVGQGAAGTKTATTNGS